MPPRKTPARVQKPASAPLREERTNLAAIPRGTFVTLRTERRESFAGGMHPHRYTSREYVRVLGNVTDADGRVVVVIEQAGGRTQHVALDDIDPTLPLSPEVKP